MLSRTQKKLREAEFFLGHLIRENSSVENRQPEAADFHLSSFFTAARSNVDLANREAGRIWAEVEQIGSSA